MTDKNVWLITGQRGMNGQQPGDPAKLADALLAQADANRELSSNLAHPAQQHTSGVVA